jgi:hypothetical protein
MKEIEKNIVSKEEARRHEEKQTQIAWIVGGIVFVVLIAATAIFVDGEKAFALAVAIIVGVASYNIGHEEGMKKQEYIDREKAREALLAEEEFRKSGIVLPKSKG